MPRPKRGRGAFTWDFIGHLQSRKVKEDRPAGGLIHSVASDSVLAQLSRHAGPETEVLVEVNLAGEETKSGIAPADLGGFLERAPVRVTGLMTMPPLAREAEESRRYFAALRELADAPRARAGSRWAPARTMHWRSRRAHDRPANRLQFSAHDAPSGLIR